MEEKKQIKVGLGTVITIFIIILLSMVLVGIYCCYNYEYEVENNQTENITKKEEDKEEPNNGDEIDKSISNEQAKDVIQSYLNIEFREYTLPKSVLDLEEIGLVNSQEYFDKNSTNIGDYWHVSENIKYSDFKDKMLEYMTEEIYQEDFSSSYKDVNGFLAALESYGKQIDSVKVDKVELLEEDNNKYVYKVEYTQYVKDETYPSKYKIELQKDKTGKYVVSFSDWWNEELEIGTYIENTEEEFGGEVKLLEDNKCIIHYGSMTGEIFSGTYEISGQTLVCELTKFIGDNIKDLNIDIKYYFDIIDSKNIKFRCVIGSVGKYYSTLPGEDGESQGEYDFKEEWHFSEGETFIFEE